MKINVTVDLDWIEEDGNIDAEVKAEIIHGVKNAISKQCLANVAKQTQSAIDEGLKTAIASIDKKVIDFVDDWLSNEITITDKYGDPEEKGTLIDIIKSRFNDTINKPVDSSGNFTSRHGGGSSLLEYFTGKKVVETIDGYLKAYNKDIDKKISSLVEKGIKDRVSDKFAEMVIGYAKQDYRDQKAIESDK